MKAGQKINMKYLIIGAGGTGGVTGYYIKSRQGRNPDRERRTPEKDPETGSYIGENVG